jgi:uncharacterized protein DUF664
VASLLLQRFTPPKRFTGAGFSVFVGHRYAITASPTFNRVGNGPERNDTMPKRTDTRPPQTGAEEKATLLGFLDYLRGAIAAKAEGVPDPQIRTVGVPSGTNLLGLVKHLAYVERFYFLGEDVDDWGATLRPTPEETFDGVLAEYREAVRRANQVINDCTDLSQPAPKAPRRRSAPSMRWVLVHMIEETGRHAGHADILREQIDGAVGR